MQQQQETRKSTKKFKCLQLDGVSLCVSDVIGNTFYRLGFWVAVNPYKTIFLSLLLTAVCSSGFLCFHNEKNPLKLWIPPDSKFLSDTEWLMKSFQEGYRSQSILFKAPDVLEPNVLRKLLNLSTVVNSFEVEVGNGTSLKWKDVCFRVPIIAELTVGSNQRTKRDNSHKIYKRESDGGGDDDDDIFGDNAFESAFSTNNTGKKQKPINVIDISPEIFCGFVNKLPIGCLLQNILEIWNFDDKKISALTKDDILNALAVTNVSATTGHQADFADLLGGIKRNKSGHIVSATGLMSNWMVYINFSNVNHDKIGNSAGTEDWASEEALLWESEFLDQIRKFKENFTNDEGIEIYYSAGRSYGDISSKTMFQDMDKIIMGSVIMFIFMMSVLSKFGWLEIRLMLASLGLFSVGMAFASAIGLCSVLGISYGPVHTSMPFLLMGLGVDDMFVMMSCWRNIQSIRQSHQKSIPERMGMMLQAAGSSIMVTSFTDVVAFSVGAITILPSLQSFCLYSGVGVLFLFIYAITFFTAVFAIDEGRIAANRNAILPCITHESSQTELWYNGQFMNRFLGFVYKKFILSTLGKIITMLFTVCVTAYSIEAVLKLEQRFDPMWFIPENTYLNQFVNHKRDLYPDRGYEASILMGQLNYSQDLSKIGTMVDQIENRTNIVYEISSWVEPFHHFVLTYFDKDFYVNTLSESEFHTYLSKFLHTPSGGKYQANFRFENKLKCGEPAPNIRVSTIDFKYKRFSERNYYVPAMHTLDEMVKEAQLKTGDGFSTVWAKIYGNWVTDEVIDTEVFRNLMLALVCVMFCTIIIIINVQICFWIFICVVLTLINVCGFMQRWGLTIDLVSCIGLELAVGLCVDYAAHIGHTFMTIENGNRSERALQTILQIGSAVLYGGLSTLLALSMLANSEAYTFQAFFKIFLLVIAFGLFFGLVFLPVILSLVGPKPHSHSAIEKNRAKSGSTNGLPEPHASDKNVENGTEMVKFIDVSKMSGHEGVADKLIDK